MAKMIHSMIRVRDEARSLAFYELFGLSIAERLEFESFSLIYLSNPASGFELELTVNKGDKSYDLGDGYGHLAFLEDDLETLRQFATLDQDSGDISGARAYIARAEVPASKYHNLALDRETILTGLSPARLTRSRGRACSAIARDAAAFKVR